MPGESTRLRLLVCHDDPAMQRAIAVVADRSGFEIAGVVTTGADAVAAAARHRPDAVVLDVALTGVIGLTMLARLSEAAPRSATIVMSPFDALRDAARDAGAYDMVIASDVRQLGSSLRRLHESTHVGCNCGETPRLSATSSTFDPGSSSIRFETGRRAPEGGLYEEGAEEPPEE